MKYAISLSLVSLVLIALALPMASDAGAKVYPVQATVEGFDVNTTVDSAVASSLINNYGKQAPEWIPTDLSERLPCRSIDAPPDTHSLQQITSDYSADTATALLIHCLATIPSNQKSQQLFLSELSRRRAGDPAQTAYMAERAEEYVVLLVPGWGYQSNANETGADLAKPRQIITSLGFENYIVAIENTGSVEGSARILAAALDRYLKTGKKIILVSASSGGPSVAYALRDPALASNSQLVGWLNICGVLNGSPVIDNFLAWPKSWLLRAVAFFEGWNYTDLLSLSRAHSKPRFEGFVPPTQLTIVNYIGIPFSGQVSELGREFYSLLKQQGPNDGLTLIPDALAPGYTIMAVGLDHFVNNDPQIDLKTAALVPVMLKLIEERNAKP